MDWLLVFLVMGLICMAAMVPMMWFGGSRWSRGFHSRDWSHFGDPEDARAILDRRYASGELTPERYQAMRAELGTGETNKA
ncbi:MAG TPA: SHOCT domain-containing protein [Candidatus Limnocylindrales bacterium]|nr:SHOCT domain-containing protein [Candidatus Limnocylindrales bacterium]